MEDVTYLMWRKKKANVICSLSTNSCQIKREKIHFSLWQVLL